MPRLAVLLIAGTLSLPPALARQEAPWLGTWTLDPQESTPEPGGSPYARVVFSIEPREGGLKVVYDMVGTRGGRTHLEWTGAFDGRDYPVQGVDYVLTNAYTLIDADSWRIVVKVDGQAAATTTASVSPDGKILTAVTSETTADGATLTRTRVYDRQ
jgi:hypothetical protein